VCTLQKGEKLNDLVQSAFADYKFLPYAEYKIPIEHLLDYIVHDVLNSFDKGAHILLAKEKNRVLGFLVCKRSEWDSRYFGKEISKIKYIATLGNHHQKRRCGKELLSHLVKISNSKILMVRVHTEDVPIIHALDDCSFQLMDTLVTYSFKFDKNEMNAFKETCKIVQCKNEATPELSKIARKSFSEAKVATDHFHADDRLDKTKSDTLSEHWIEEACKDKDCMVLVAEIDDHAVGFTSCKIYRHLDNFFNRKIGAMILSAVSPEYRRRGVYTSMIHAGLRWFSSKVDIVELGTQIGNYPVQRAWSQLGFKITRSQYTLHKWI
jgi:ribosomal protein S18 acetylase RimI-like enzyme